MNSQEITNVIKNLKPGDYITVTSKASGKMVDFHQIVEKVEQISTGWMLVYRAGFTPGISDGRVYRDAFKNINAYRDINHELNIWDIKVVSQGNDIPQHVDDYLKSSHRFKRPRISLKGNPGYDLMM